MLRGFHAKKTLSGTLSCNENVPELSFQGPTPTQPILRFKFLAFRVAKPEIRV